MSIQIAIYDKPDGTLLADWSSRVQGLQSSTGVHGFLDCTGFVDMPLVEAARWYSRPGVHVEISGPGTTIWEGRLEDPALVAGGFAFKAMGYWSATHDVPFTGTYVGPVGSDTIVRDLLPSCPALQNNAARVSAYGLSVYNEVYEDVYPDEILTHLAQLGEQWEGGGRIDVAVWEDRYLTYQAHGLGARDWIIEVTDPEVERSLSTLWNEVYTFYKPPSGSPRTPLIADPISAANYGLTRRAVVKSNTPNLAQAQAERAAYWNDHREMVPRAKVKIDRIYTKAGTIAPLYNVRAGDRITIRNLPPSNGLDFERIRTFDIAATDYAWDTDTLTITPEAPLATLDVLIARSEETR